MNKLTFVLALLLSCISGAAQLPDYMRLSQPDHSAVGRQGHFTIENTPISVNVPEGFVFIDGNHPLDHRPQVICFVSAEHFTTQATWWLFSSSLI